MTCDKIWSLPEAQTRLSCKKSKLYDLLKRGEIRAFRWEGRRYIRDDELRRFIDHISGHAPPERDSRR